MTGIEITTFNGAQAALKHPDLAQALYDDGKLVMEDALITLHGADHAERRAAEYGVFNRRFFRTYESETFPRTLRPVMAPYLAAGQADLVELGYRVTMNLTADFAGIDRDEDSIEETESLLGLVKIFSTGATQVHTTQDPDEINRKVAVALEEFEDRFLSKSIARRVALRSEGAALPNDVLSMLVARSETLPLAPDVLRREMAFYLQAGAHSTANSTTHAFHEIGTWAGDDTKRARLLEDPLFLQRCVHESLRLHPASPVAWRKATRDTAIDNRPLREGDRIVINLHEANRDTSVFGADADRFNPERDLPPSIWPFGLSFGYGIHACMGRGLDGGILPDARTTDKPVQLGIVTLLVKTLIENGAALMADNPPQPDTTTSRSNWGTYPVQFERAA